MIHGGLRSMIYRKGLDFIDVNPQRTKKFVNVGRVPSNEKKKVMADAAKEHFKYKHPSDNVTDAYIIARIAQAVYRVRQKPSELAAYRTYQAEVISAIINPVAGKKPKAKSNKRPGKPAAAGSHTHSAEQPFLF
jgi:crossover junction endodeoxyribonuclease RuvC